MQTPHRRASASRWIWSRKKLHSPRFCPLLFPMTNLFYLTFTFTHTHSDGCIRDRLGFSILPKDTLTYRQEELGIKATFRSLHDLFSFPSHGRPNICTKSKKSWRECGAANHNMWCFFEFWARWYQSWRLKRVINGFKATLAFMHALDSHITWNVIRAGNWTGHALTTISNHHWEALEQAT